jgi:hypothetical protein
MKAVRLGLGLVGIVLAIIGVTRDDRRIVWVAIAAMIVALALRLKDRRGRSTR